MSDREEQAKRVLSAAAMQEAGQDMTMVPPEVLAQLQQFHNQLNPKMVAVSITSIWSNGKTELQGFYNPDGLFIEVSSQAERQRTAEETTETKD